LTSLLKEISGITPARMYGGCTRNAYHLYMFRYDEKHFGGIPRSVFLSALSAEGIPAAGGYSPLNSQAFLKNALRSRGYKKLFPEKALAEWDERNCCSVNDRLYGEAVWFTQNMLLGQRSSIDLIAGAIRKTQANVALLPRAWHSLVEPASPPCPRTSVFSEKLQESDCPGFGDPCFSRRLSTCSIFVFTAACIAASSRPPRTSAP